MEKIILGNIQDHSYTMMESLRALKTNIQFMGNDIQLIMFTSCIPDEGKSTVVMNVARSFAESSKRVLIIDTDIRKSVLVSRLGVKTESGKPIKGLSHYLSGQNTLTDILYETNIENISMIFAGPSAVNPTELLEKPFFQDLLDQARKEYDYVLVDCAPLGAAIDAAIVAKRCDGSILVVAQDMASTRMILNAKKQLDMAGVRILGAILNKVGMKKLGYYGNYYGNYGTAKHDSNRKR